MDIFIYLICYCLCVLDDLPGLNALVHLLSKQMEIMLLFDKVFLQYAVHALASLRGSHLSTENFLVVSRDPLVPIIPQRNHHFIVLQVVSPNEVLPCSFKF